MFILSCNSNRFDFNNIESFDDPINSSFKNILDSVFENYSLGLSYYIDTKTHKTSLKLKDSSLKKAYLSLTESYINQDNDSVFILLFETYKVRNGELEYDCHACGCKIDILLIKKKKDAYRLAWKETIEIGKWGMPENYYLEKIGPYAYSIVNEFQDMQQGVEVRGIEMYGIIQESFKDRILYLLLDDDTQGLEGDNGYSYPSDWDFINYS